MKIRYVLPLLMTAVLAGCAHSTMRGSVAMKASDDEAHICMGDKEVKDHKVAVRKRGKGDVGSMQLEKFIAEIQKEILEKK